MNEELEDYQKEMSQKRRAYAQARAILGRARSAGIPKKYMRIRQDEFASILDPQYHPNAQSFAETVYKSPKFLFKKPFIIIDGGNIYSRKTAGFAILFRMIACDRYGTYSDTNQLCGEFQTIKYGGENRNDVVAKLKVADLLFLGEYGHKLFKTGFESGKFFDQLLESRDDYQRPTIITFSKPLEGKDRSYTGNAVYDDISGNYFAMLSQADLQDNKNVIRIRVK